ncbi:hypothetical protein BDV96DRAFT_362657 [Lophiotrema nucula]|uniref:rRNA biogenesis protein RRP36 n=1 Tax=Lophiotrema nucula TaxID=690887 RepID=A0A6A5ZH57_9PLEO|nr:hypothetical protein BDV96DRAFT_362657 [Lophiotrema nucula]
MPLSTKLGRKLQATEDDSDDSSNWEVSDRSSPSIIDTGEGADIVSSAEEEQESDGSEDEERYQQRLSNVSFGDLAKAHESMTRKRKRGEPTSAAQDDKLQALRERLRELKAAKGVTGGKSSKSAKATRRQEESDEGMDEDEDADEDEDEDTDGGSESDAAPRSRSSKHAPAVQSSKRAVTRRRNAVEVKKPVSRDPRFDNVAGLRPDESTMKKRYGFLDDYKASEMAELKAAIKKTKNEDEKEKLKRKLLSMESQKKAKDAKEKQQEIAREHKKKEKELVKQGKTPFYLKKSEQKKIALVDRFQNMKSKQRDKVIERRRKKTTARERRNMPSERRAG